MTDFTGIPAPSATLLYGFWALLGLTLFAAFAAVRHYTPSHFKRAMVVVAGWLALNTALVMSGVAANFDLRPPPLLAVFVLGFGGCVLVARSAWGSKMSERAPIALLVGFQAFRFPLELLLHRAHSDGLMPVQMSFGGANFDIVSGLLGLTLGLWAWRSSRPLPAAVVWAYNIVAFGLLLGIIGIAIASTPVFAAWGPDALNVWVAESPFILLPAVFVMFAFVTHLLTFRHLLRARREA